MFFVMLLPYRAKYFGREVKRHFVMPFSSPVCPFAFCRETISKKGYKFTKCLRNSISSFGGWSFRLQSFTFHIHVLVRVQNRCKHFMIDQTRSGKFVIVGMPRVYKSLKEMVEVHKKVKFSLMAYCLKKNPKQNKTNTTKGKYCSVAFT